MPRNWSASMGNDDQAFWAFAALIAAETGFDDPPADTKLDWLALAQAVFNEQTEAERRTYEGSCSGLLRWQAVSLNNGWDYINTIANTCYFNIGTRLARYFDNQTLADFVGETYDMLVKVNYIDDDGNVYDGGHEGEDCKDINKAQFSYNAALLIEGLAHLYNMVSKRTHLCSPFLVIYQDDRPMAPRNGNPSLTTSCPGRWNSSSPTAPQSNEPVRKVELAQQTCCHSKDLCTGGCSQRHSWPRTLKTRLHPSSGRQHRQRSTSVPAGAMGGCAGSGGQRESSTRPAPANK